MKSPAHKNDKEPEKDDPSPLRSYARYSGIAFQMAIIILVAVWGGKKLDEISGNEKPVFTALMALAGVLAAIYISIKDLIKKL